MKRVLLLFTMLMVSCSLLFAQERQVTGKVTDQTGAPLPGVTVQIKGTTSGTATDANGRFTLSVPSNATLIIRGVGFQEQQIVAGSRSDISVSLSTAEQKLNELVVTALGVKREARELGYGTAEVSAKDLNTSRPVTISQGLAGKVAGLQINTINNGVSPDVRVVLRGYRHLSADNQALIVVDGVPVRNNFLLSLDPNTVQNVTVLKGASAAALYGVEATNGVLVITTKRGGEGGKPVINYSNTTTLERVSYMPKLQTKFGPGSGETGPAPWNPAYYLQDPYTGFINYVPYENQQYGPEFNGDTSVYGPNSKGYLGGPLPDGSYFRHPYSAEKKDPRLNFFQTGLTIQNNLSYSGGDDKNSYFLSVQDVSVKGTVPQDKSRRTGATASGKRTFGRFSADFSLNYSEQMSNTVGGDFNQGRPVYWNLLNNGANVPIPGLKDIYTDPFAGLDWYVNAYYPNPWWQIYNSRNIDRNNNFNGNLTLNLAATDWMNLTYRAGVQTTTERFNSTIAAVSFSPAAIADPWDASNIASSIGLHKNGGASDYDYLFRRVNQDILLTFQKKIGDFSGTLILGNSIWERSGSYIGIRSSNLFIDGFYNLDYRLGELQKSLFSDGSTLGNFQYESKTRQISGFADLTLGYKNFLFGHAAFRRDWSSLLAPGHNAYNVYNLDASFVFTDAIPSLKDNNIISYGKLRGAWSSTGQIAVGAYNTRNVFDVPGGFPFGSQAGLSMNGSYRNPELKPEHAIEKEIGVDLGFWNDRINLTTNYYRTNTTDQTFLVGLSSFTGFSSAYVNAGELLSQGLEVGLNIKPLIRTAGGFSWDVGVNFTWNDSKLISLYGDVTDLDIGLNNHAVVGKPFPVFEVQDLKRDPQGHVIVDPKTGYPILNPNTEIVKYTDPRTTPTYIAGFTTALKYKNLTLNALAEYRGGYSFYAFVGKQLDFTGASQFTASNNRQDFIFPNSVIDMGDGKYAPNTQYYTRDGNRGFWTQSDFTKAGTTYLMNGAFWKLRSLSLSYDFSDLVKNNKVIRGLSFTVVGNDLLMLRPGQNVWTDPEFNTSNRNAQSLSDYNQLPPTRKFGASLSVKF